MKNFTLAASLFIIFTAGTADAQVAGIKKVLTDIGVANNTAKAIVTQPDGKTIVSGSITEGNQAKIVFYRMDNNGALDPSFGVKGASIFYNFLPATYQGASIAAIALQPDGKIIAAGTAWYLQGTFFQSNVLVMRLNANGSIDSSFGENGTIRTNIFSANGPSVDDAFDVLVAPDGKIIAGGTSYDYTQNRMLFIRYLQDGSIDPSFNQGGVNLIDIQHRDDKIFGLALQADGKIIGAGQTFDWDNGGNDFGYDVALVRLKENGKPDNTFGSSGIVITKDKRGNDIAKSVALQSNNRIVIAGSSSSGKSATTDILAIRYKKDGTPDSSFAKNGIFIKDLNGANDGASVIRVQSNDKIVISGNTTAGSTTSFVTMKLNIEGKPVADFGTNGIVTTGIFNQSDVCNAMTLQDNNTILLAGQSANGASRLFSHVRYTSNGILDSSYGKEGIETISLSVSNDRAEKMVRLPWSNSLLVCGIANNYWALANYRLPDLKPVTSFGVNGISSYNFSNQYEDKTPEIAIDSALQKIYLAGRTDDEGFIILRLNKNGSIDTTFGEKGAVSYFVSIYYGGLAVLPDHKIVIGGVVQSGSTGYSMIARFNVNGTVDSLFGTDGEVRNLPMTPNSIITDMYKNRMLIGGPAPLPFFEQAVSAMAIKYNGVIDSSFGVNGLAVKKSILGSAAVYRKYNIAQDVYGRVLVCGATGGFSVTRFTATGQPDSLFGTGGMVVTKVGSNGYTDVSNEGIATRCSARTNCSVVTAGIKVNDNNEKSRLVIVAYDGSGKIDSIAHTSLGYIDTSFLGDSYEGAYAALFDKDAIYFAGKAGEKNRNDFLVIKADLQSKKPIVPQALKQDYILNFAPNPAHGYTTIRYNAGKAATVQFQLLALSGNRTYNLLKQTGTPGYQEIRVTFPAGIPKGLYQLKMITPEGVTAKMILLE